MRPSIACVITTNNRPEFLKEALESVAGQRRQPDAIIVSDSQPVSRTPEILQLFEGRFVKVLYHHWKTPATPYANVKCAFGLAEADYIAWLHDDDLWEPDHLLDCEHAIIANPEAWLYFSQAMSFGFTDAHVIAPPFFGDVHEATHEPAGSDVCRWLTGFGVACSSVVFRRQALESIRCFWKAKTGAIDYLWWVQMATMGGFVYNPRLGSRYRIHGGNETNTVLSGRGGAASMRYACRAISTLTLRQSLLAPSELEGYLLTCPDIDAVAGVIFSLSSFGCDASLRKSVLKVANHRRDELGACRSRHTRIAARLGWWYFPCADLLDRAMGRWWPGEVI